MKYGPFNDKKRIVMAILALIALIALYLVSAYDYLLFHVMVEIISAVIALCFFIIAWHSRKYMKNDYLLLLGIAYFFVAVIGLIHTLTYQGMSLLPVSGTNVASQLWIAARLIESVSLLAAPFFIRRKLNQGVAIAAYASLSLLVVASILVWQVFPAAYVEGEGQTTFKVVGEFVVIAILVAAGFLLYRGRKYFDDNVFRLIFASIAATILGELAFAFYFGPFDLLNFIGHVFYVLSFYFIYRAVIVTGIENPFGLIFRDLNESRRELRKSKEQAELYVDLMAHDVNNLNQVGVGYLDLLLASDGLGEKERALAKKAHESLDNSSSLIKNVRKIRQANMTAGRKDDIDVAELLDKVKSSYSSVPGKEVTIDYLRPEACVVCADSLLKDVFSNIVENAVKYGPHKVHIDIRVDMTDDMGVRSYRVSIADNGPGITDELKPRLFDRYQRGDSRVKGSGLGLYLVRTLVDDYRGKVWVEDRVPGDHTQGSKFVVMLPAGRCS